MRKLFLLLFSGLVLSACYHDSKPAVVNPVPPQETTKSATVSTPQNQPADIEISGFKFSPDSLTVKPGQVISVVNRDSVSHTLTSVDGKSFDTGLLGKDQTGSITAPAAPGTYSYICIPHPNMKGTLVVE